MEGREGKPVWEKSMGFGVLSFCLEYSYCERGLASLFFESAVIETLDLIQSRIEMGGFGDLNGIRIIFEKKKKKKKKI